LRIPKASFTNELCVEVSAQLAELDSSETNVVFSDMGLHAA
jgi:hypothetical protein